MWGTKNYNEIFLTAQQTKSIIQHIHDEAQIR